jgi:aspartate/methionine/tyrosine aminotransferase
MSLAKPIHLDRRWTKYSLHGINIAKDVLRLNIGQTVEDGPVHVIAACMHALLDLVASTGSDG